MVMEAKNRTRRSLFGMVSYGLFVMLCCVLVLSIVPIVVCCAIFVRQHPIALLGVVSFACFVWIGLRVSRKRRWSRELARGRDFGLQKDWLSEVPRLLDLHGVPVRKSLARKLVLPPRFRKVAARYNLVKCKKGPPLFSRKLMAELRIGCKDGKDYYCFAGRDEVYYCVRVSDSDETIYKLELEWSMPPVPFASGTPRQAWLNYHDERNMNHKQTEM